MCDIVLSIQYELNFFVMHLLSSTNKEIIAAARAITYCPDSQYRNKKHKHEGNVSHHQPMRKVCVHIYRNYRIDVIISSISMSIKYMLAAHFRLALASFCACDKYMTLKRML